MLYLCYPRIWFLVVINKTFQLLLKLVMFPIIAPQLDTHITMLVDVT